MLVVGTAEQCVETLRPYVELGARDFVLGSMAPYNDWPTIERVANEVGPALKAGVAA
jgi:alkanesulfonate monooxygenase SsuD/methylene tetrahydromethanopterin reductase-like flavin-dependent oxidoreductase (luciferase family)